MSFLLNQYIIYNNSLNVCTPCQIFQILHWAHMANQTDGIHSYERVKKCTRAFTWLWRDKQILHSIAYGFNHCPELISLNTKIAVQKIETLRFKIGNSGSNLQSMENCRPVVFTVNCNFRCYVYFECFVLLVIIRKIPSEKWSTTNLVGQNDSVLA